MIDLRDSKQKDSKGFYKSVCCSVSQSCPTLYDPIDCIMPGFPVHHHLSEFAQTHVHWVCDAIKPSRPLSSPLPPAFSLPSIRVFSSELTFHIRWPKYWSFSFSIIPSKEIPGLISFRMDWFDLLAVQGTLKSLLQHHSLKASFLWCSAFFIVQLSHLYLTTGKTIVLTGQTFVGKVMSLLFNTLSRFVIAFLPRSKYLISWLQSPSAVILEPKKRKSLTLFTMKWWDWMPWSLFFECWVLKQLFHSLISSSSRGCLSLLRFLPFGCCHLHIWGCCCLSQQSWFQLMLHPAQYFAWCTLHIS